MRLLRGALAFVLMFVGVMLYQTAPYIIQNVAWDSSRLFKAVAVLVGGLGLVVAFTTFVPAGKRPRAKRAGG